MSTKRNQTTSPIGSPLSPDNSTKEQDRFLPIANVSRIMKKSLPANAKISKEAKETVQECVSEFISFITGEASDKCQREKRKTINGDDLLWAMTTLGFENYVGPLKVYLNKYREVEGEKNTMARQEDHSPTNTPPISNHGVHDMVNRAAAANSAPNKVDFQDFNGGGFYSLGGQMGGPKSYDEMSGMVIGYGDNYVSGGYNVNGMNMIHESGGDHGNPNMVMAAAQLHHGNIGW
ncbi:Nuclear transcription factor Y subunit B [Trema orientale]|uniref:Nuclear transcription factor Y subunit B n=1 Tax=Trema orientale TaxID=63057 RepID=A0A2P5BPX9_TREOI|nr:Nuclear transcription factor Y subunit B [Trema orientale]